MSPLWWIQTTIRYVRFQRRVHTDKWVWGKAGMIPIPAGSVTNCVEFVEYGRSRPKVSLVRILREAIGMTRAAARDARHKRKTR